jgi:hypothetical protein
MGEKATAVPAAVFIDTSVIRLKGMCGIVLELKDRGPLELDNLHQFWCN